MYAISEASQPITGRGVGYKLFTLGMIPSMAERVMKGTVYRLLKEAREEGTIPWEWIVDESRHLERAPTWVDLDHYADTVANSYRREFWNRQPVRVEVWSEKGTVRGVLAPVLKRYGDVGFRPLHGYNSATSVHDISMDGDGRPLVALYVGDHDPSGMQMSEVDLPKRLEKYGGDHIELARVALLPDDLGGLPSFPASDKEKDPRYKWYLANYGVLSKRLSGNSEPQCWELDAMDPNDLRARVEEAIRDQIDWDAWEKDERINKAERESVRALSDTLRAIKSNGEG